jgi:hypothetical protein
MLVSIPLDQIDYNNIQFMPSIKNHIIVNGTFRRCMYVNGSLSLNGIYTHMNLSGGIIDKHFNKYRCTFTDNHDVLSKLVMLEQYILNTHKLDTQTISPSFQSTMLKIHTEHESINNIYILKISGI